MSFDFPTVEGTEGRARLLVPDVPRRKGPGKRGPWPFYNPTMVVNRDLCALVLARWPVAIREALDGLAGTGVWGIRMALEGRVPAVTFGDRLPASAPLIRANLVRNGIVGEVLTSDLRDVLAARAFDFVDIDPFGPPTPFLDAALRAAPAPSGIGITATDVAPLSGAYPDACLRRYGAKPLRCPQGHEIGLRILLGYAERVARGYGKSLRPILCFAAEHFLRIHALVLDASDESPKAPVGFVVRRTDGAFVQVPRHLEDAIGPLWLGHLHDPLLVRRLAPSEWTSPGSARLLARLQDEAELPAFFVTTDELAERLRGSPPKLAAFLAAFRAAGFRATRTHFHDRGVKTDAPHEEVVRIFRSLSSS